MTTTKATACLECDVVLLEHWNFCPGCGKSVSRPAPLPAVKSAALLEDEALLAAQAEVGMRRETDRIIFRAGQQFARRQGKEGKT